MKGAIAAFTEACARFLAKRGRDFGGSISLLITGDEEGPAVNGTVKMLKKLAERGETLGVNSTPSLFINGVLYKGARSVEELDAAFAKLAK